MAPKRKKRATALSPQRDDPGWQLIDSKIGGRKGLLSAAMSSANPKAAILAELLLDPAFQKAGTKILAQKAGLTAPEVVDLFRDKKWLETTLVLHENLPEIIEGAAMDAKPSFEPCEECHGEGCWRCDAGKVRRAGDKDKLSFIGEAVGMVGKKGPLVQTNIQVNAQTQTASLSFEDMMRRATIDSSRKVIEGEVIENGDKSN